MLKCQYLDMPIAKSCIYTYTPRTEDVAWKWKCIVSNMLGGGIVVFGLILGAKHVLKGWAGMSVIVCVGALFSIALGIAFCLICSYFIISRWPSAFSVWKGDEGIALVRGRVHKVFPSKIKWVVECVTLCKCPVYSVRIKFREGVGALRFYHLEELDECQACLERYTCVKSNS